MKEKYGKRKYYLAGVRNAMYIVGCAEKDES